jgi:hypothetical protein
VVAHKTGPHVVAAAESAPVTAPEGGSATESQGSADPVQCDVEMCANAYDGFRASDCTYQPRRGPRKVCAIPPQSAAIAPETRAQLNSRASPPATWMCAPAATDRSTRRTAAISRMAAARVVSVTRSDEGSTWRHQESALSFVRY